MDLPPNAELLGSSAEQLPLSSAGIAVLIPLTPAGRYHLAAPDEHTGPERLYMALENVRGTRDAAVLNVYLTLPAADPRPAEQRLVGGAALYGLRLASLPGGGNGAGLTLVFELTAALVGLSGTQLVQGPGLHVRVAPSRPLPDAPDITIGRVSVFRLPPE